MRTADSAQFHLDPSEVRICRNTQRRNRQLRRRLTALSVVLFSVVLTVVFISFGTVSDASTQGMPMGEKYYTMVCVSAGESLWKIASDYYEPAYYASTADYMNEIMSINHVDTDTVLAAGSELIIPYHVLKQTDKD